MEEREESRKDKLQVVVVYGELRGDREGEKYEGQRVEGKKERSEKEEGSKDNKGLGEP
jgi:hypothetical protein